MDGAVGQRIQQKLATRRLASGENDAHAATKAAEKLHRRLARLAEKLEMSELATSEASSHVAELMKRGAGAPAAPAPPAVGAGAAAKARSRSARDGDFLEAKTTAWIRFAAEELALEVAAKAKAEPDDHRACCAVLQDALAVRRGLVGFRRYSVLLDLACHLELSGAPRGAVLDAVVRRLAVLREARTRPDADDGAAEDPSPYFDRVARPQFPPARRDWAGDAALATTLADAARHRNGDVAVALAAARVERAAVALADGDRPLAVACLADIESDAGLARVSVAQNPRLRLAAGCLGDADGPPPPPPRLDFTFGCGCAPAFELPDFGLPRR
ncbi:hypothetical protein JL720_9820 [Aureococcus anophagefferens]|nr:hypothetical protein JL720_9820 [Aureococcus anophagefferens]